MSRSGEASRRPGHTPDPPPWTNRAPDPRRCPRTSGLWRQRGWDARLRPATEHRTMILGLILALASALATNVAFLFKHRGAVLAAPIRVRHPLRSAADL